MTVFKIVNPKTKEIRTAGLRILLDKNGEYSTENEKEIKILRESNFFQEKVLPQVKKEKTK